MTTGLSMSEVALKLGRSKDWLRRNWRTLPGFPRPYVGGELGQHPRWAEAAIDRFMMGEGGTATPAAQKAAPRPANDTKPSLVDRLLTLAGS